MATDKQNEALPTADDLPADCLPIAELLAAWVDGGLQGDEARAVTRHVAHCARCEAESQTLRVLLADLHGALQSDDQGRDPVFWATMAANIDAAIAHTPQGDANEDPSNVVALPPRHWRTVAWALGGALAAALLAVLGLHVTAEPPQQAKLAASAPQWTDALQARMAIDDDPASGDSDPIDELDDLDDDEVQELATQLGEEG